MASFLQFAHHCFFLVSSTACCFSDSVCFFTSATNRSLSCSRLCLISAIVSSAVKSDKIKITWNWRCGKVRLIGNSPRLCFISDNSCWCNHWSFSISILNRRICGRNTRILKFDEWNYLTLIGTRLCARFYLCNCISRGVFGKVIVDFCHCPFYRVHDL